MRRLLLALVLVSVAPRGALALWEALDPSYVASTCPVVVTGEIVEITEGAVEAGGRLLEVARIKVAEVRKNLLDDVDVKPGALIDARMQSRKGGLRTGDLRYPVGTKAMWMLYLDADGAFYINRRPEQCQRDEGKAKEIQLDRVVRTVVKGRSRPFTRAEWIAAENARLRREAEEAAARKKEWELTEDSIKQGIRALYDDNVLQPDRLPTLLDLPSGVRSSLVNRSGRELGISHDDWITIHCFLAKKEPIENHRVRSLPLKIGGSERLRKLLLESVTDPSSRMRLFACQALFASEEKDPEIVAAVVKLLDDDIREVRMTAVRALGRLGDRSHVGPILALYRQREITEGEAWVFAETLARLGETEVPLECFRKAMTSENWNIRRFAAESLWHIDKDRAVIAAMAALPGELRQTIGNLREHRIADQVLLTLVGLLTDRTGQKHGRDIMAWLTWWQGAANHYGRTDARFDADEVRKLQAEYRELLARPPQ
jgi:hypothetical protein